MARRVFFSFHYKHDIWRANQVRNCNVVAGPEIAGFFDHSEYLAAKFFGDNGIRSMVLRHLDRTSVTVVLIGTYTWQRPWVAYEIQQSILRKNALLGIYIHHLKDQFSLPSMRGPKPYVFPLIDFPAYDWDYDLDRFRNAIEEAGKRADKLRAIV